MLDRACIFRDGSDNCFIIVNKVILWFTSSFEFSEEPQMLICLGSYCSNVILFLKKW